MHILCRGQAPFLIWRASDVAEVKLARNTRVIALRGEPVGSILMVGICRFDLPTTRQLYAHARMLHRRERQTKAWKTRLGSATPEPDGLAQAMPTFAPARAGMMHLPNASGHGGGPWPVGSAQVQLQARLRELEQDLAQQKWKAARIAHDLRLPLGALRATLATLSGTSGATLNHARTQRMRRQIELLEALCHDLLALELGLKGTPRVDYRDLQAMVAEVADVQSDALAKRGISLVMMGTAQLLVPALVARILQNLIDNARRHACKHIWLEIRQNGNTACVEVEDDGPGLPAEAVVRGLAHSNISRDAGGWGVGLASCLTMAEQARGQLRVLPPRRANGARFLLVLPGNNAEVRLEGHGADSPQEHYRETLG